MKATAEKKLAAAALQPGCNTGFKQFFIGGKWRREPGSSRSSHAVKWLACAVLLMAVVLSGCQTYPVSKDLRKQAQVITMNQVRANPEGTRGAIVIWGGRIINVVNRTNGGAIYIVCLPIDSNERPVNTGFSPGRFIATSTDFIDPQMFPQRSLVTVAGQLAGVSTEKLGNIQYTYPVLNIREINIWPTESQGYGYYPYYSYYGPGWGPYWGWGWGWGWPWWWGGVYYPVYGFHGGFHGSFHGSFHGNGGGGEEFHGGGGEFHGGGGEFHGGGGEFHGGGGGGGGSFHGR